MKTVLAFSSQVVRGSVGLAAIQPALTAMGIRVLVMPTVLISNHPGHAFGAGLSIAPGLLEEMADALDANGWLEEIDAVISGYLPSAEHAAVVRRLVQRLRGLRDVVYLCDPVIGDGPKGLYVDVEAAAAIRDELVGVADIVTPNAFELEWLTGQRVCDEQSARVAASQLAAEMVVATSIPVLTPGAPQMLANVVVEGGVVGGKAWRVQTETLKDVAHGTGDLFSALLLGHVLAGHCGPDAAARATAGVRTVIEASAGSDELLLTGTLGEAVVARQDAVEYR